MKKLILIGLPLVLAGLLLLSLSSRQAREFRDATASVIEWSSLASTRSRSQPHVAEFAGRNPSGSAPRDQQVTPLAAPLSEEQTKAARLERIKQDYDLIALAVLDGLGADDKETAVHDSHTIRRQLALLEHERRRDLAAVLTPRELEDIELKQTISGRLVNRLLGETNASEDQRRAVFRLQREFELQLSQRLDPDPRMYWEREQARQQTQEKIRAVLGDPLFGSWLAGEGELHAKAVAFATQHGFSPRIADELRRTRDDYRLRILELHATQGMQGDQLRATTQALIEQAKARAVAILGPALSQTARAELLNWLPQE